MLLRFVSVLVLVCDVGAFYVVLVRRDAVRRGVLFYVWFVLLCFGLFWVALWCVVGACCVVCWCMCLVCCLC